MLDDRHGAEPCLAAGEGQGIFECRAHGSDAGRADQRRRPAKCAGDGPLAVPAGLADQVGGYPDAAVAEIEQLLDVYNVGGACQVLLEYLEVLTNWYIRRSRHRFWAGERAAMDTLWTVLEAVCRAAAPLLPYTTEAIWRGLTGEPSVHLASWPDVSAWPQDAELTGAMDLVRAACSTALGLRKARGLRVRLPLAALVIAHPDAKSLEPFTELIAEEVNVKSVELSAEVARLGTFELAVNPRLLGPRLGGTVQEVIRAVKAGAWARSGDRITAAGVESGDHRKRFGDQGKPKHAGVSGCAQGYEDGNQTAVQTIFKVKVYSCARLPIPERNGGGSRIEGVGLEILAREALMRHKFAMQPAEESDTELEIGGSYQYRERGERHILNPLTISKLQHAVRQSSFPTYQEFARIANEQSRNFYTLRGLLDLNPAGPPVPLEDVEPAAEIVKRFATGAMSFGSISKEAHETLAIAMNRIGGRSNTGEGGEDEERFKRDANGDWRRSAIKQVASARFGVTTNYLVNADDLQIKIAQGAKPGEGGQLPGHKVDEVIARVRHSIPGVQLISPPPHHDIYSIEDLAQLIYDLKNVNPQARSFRQVGGRIGRRDGGGGRVKGSCRRHPDQRIRWRHRRLAHLFDSPRGNPLGARPFRNAANAGDERSAQPRAPSGGWKTSDRP